MARFLAIDWDNEQLNIVAGVASRGAVQFQNAASFAETEAPNVANARSKGVRLREHLRAAGIAPAPVIVSLGRDRVILKDIRFPAASPSEEAALVRFQVARELNYPVDEVVIDYAVIGDVDGQRRALAFVLRRELLAAYQELCRAAGLKLLAMAPRAHGFAASLAQSLEVGKPGGAVSPDRLVGVVSVGKPWAEFSIFAGGSLLFTRSLKGNPLAPAEVRRNTALFNGQSGREPVSAIYLADGDECHALCEQLQQALEIPVVGFDPLKGVPDRAPNAGAFTGPSGLMVAWVRGKSLPINFVKPKEPRPERSPYRRRLVFAGALAATLVFATVAICRAQLSARDARLAALFEEKTDLDYQLTRLDEDTKCIKALDDWTSGEIVWLDELYDLTYRSPDPARLQVTQLIGGPITRTGKEKHVARLELKGVMKDDHQAVNQLENHLVEDSHYRVEPKVVSRTVGSGRSLFPFQFTTRMELERLPPDRFTLQMTEPDSETTRRERRDEGTSFPSGGFTGFGGEEP